MFHMDFGLGRVEAALGALGLVRPPYRVAHVVGTNGKGSTSRMLAETAMAHGLRAGLYASPHFVSVRERVLVDGRMLDEAAWVRLGNEVMAASGPDGLTYFEFITVLAVLAFARAGVDVAVMEAGLGGRYDACTAMAADVVVFTPMGLDHTAVLGDTLAAIAADKAGALRPGAPAVTAPQAPEARAELEAAAARIGVDLRLPGDVPGPVPEPLRPGMAGPHQVANARLALAAWRLLATGMERDADPDACAAAVARALVPGRLQRVPAGERGPQLYLDGAHNPHALRAPDRRAPGRGASVPRRWSSAACATRTWSRWPPWWRPSPTGRWWPLASPGTSGPWPWTNWRVRCPWRSRPRRRARPCATAICKVPSPRRVFSAHAPRAHALHAGARRLGHGRRPGVGRRFPGAGSHLRLPVPFGRVLFLAPRVPGAWKGPDLDLAG